MVSVVARVGGYAENAPSDRYEWCDTGTRRPKSWSIRGVLNGTDTPSGSSPSPEMDRGEGDGGWAMMGHAADSGRWMRGKEEANGHGDGR